RISMKDIASTCCFFPDGAGLCGRDGTSSSSTRPVGVRLIGFDLAFLDFERESPSGGGGAASEKPCTSASAKQSAAAWRTCVDGESTALKTAVSSLSKSV